MKQKKKQFCFYIFVSPENKSMDIIKFLTSKIFLKQILLSIAVLFVLIFILLKWLNVTTNHGDFETVPKLKGKSIEMAISKLEENNLVIKIQDSANYNPRYPKFSVVGQEPAAGTKVKKNRKIYITLNPSGYRKMNIPEGLVDKTFREVKLALVALGFNIGKITYADNIAKDMVLKLTHKGNVLKAGDKLAKTTAIDLVLGNGKRK